MKSSIIKSILGLLLAALPALAESGTDVTYEFITLAETSPQVTAILTRGLNNRGDVLFLTQATDGSDTLWLADSKEATAVVQGARNTILGNAPSLSDSGRFTFLFREQNPVSGAARDRIILAQEAQWQTLLEVHPAIDGQLLGPPVLNNEGIVAWRVTSQPEFVIRIIASDGGTLRTVFEGLGATAIVSTPIVNNLGVVAFENTNIPSEHGVYLWHDGVSTRVFDPNSQPGEFSRRLSAAALALNDNNSVAVRTLSSVTVPLPDGTPIDRIVTNRVVRVDGGVVTTIAHRTSEFQPSTVFSMNNRGEVAFAAVDALGRVSLNVGDGTFTHRVLGAGDSLGGRLVARPLASAINERGQLAFVVNYSDGGRALLLATPIKEK